MEVKIIAVQENKMKDKESGDNITLYKINFVLDGAVAELWTPNQYKVGDIISLKIAVGSKYRPVVKIA